MKAEALGTEASQHSEPPTQAQKQSASGRYLLAAALLLVVYLVSSWNPSEAGPISLGIAPSFLLFWLAGGSLTLGILAMAAKKNS